MTTCSMTSRLMLSVAIGFGIGALSSVLSDEAYDCDFGQPITSSQSSASTAQAQPELAARFVVRRSGSKPGELYFVRSVQRDDTLDALLGEAKSARPDWLQLASSATAQWLGKLERSGKKQIFGQTATHYRGQIGAENINLWWLEQSGLPAQLLSNGPHGSLALQLKELHARAPATWPLSDEPNDATQA